MKKNEIILATNNPHKVTEIKALLSDLDFTISTLQDFPGIPEVVEDGVTLEENAEKKASTIYRLTGLTSLADDTGLEVDFLEGAPGVYSSRFSGENATYNNNNLELLQSMMHAPWEERKAKFRCVMAIVENGKVTLLDGSCDGYIKTEPAGEDGFGYDPLFYVPEYGKTFAEMPLSLKNIISHRAKALLKVKQYFQNLS